MKEICFSVLLTDSDVFVASFPLFWHHKTFAQCVESLELWTQSWIVVAQTNIRLAKNLLPT